VWALGPRLRRVAEPVTPKPGVATGERAGRRFQEQKAGWAGVLAAPQRPATSPRLAPHALARTFGLMPAWHPAEGSQETVLRGLAPRYNLVPSPRRAPQAGPGGVAVEGGRVPPHDGFLNLPILTAGGFR